MSAGLGGAIAGGLSGNLAGAGLGLRGGLCGSGDSSQNSQFTYEKLSRLLQGAADSGAGAVTRLSDRLGSGHYDALREALAGQFGEVASTQVNDSFAQARAQQQGVAARSGGQLGSVQQGLDRQTSVAKSKAMMEALLSGQMTAEQLVSSRMSNDIAGINAGTNAVSGIYGTRQQTGQTTTAPGNTWGDLLNMGMGALSNPLSAFNTASGDSKFGKLMGALGGGQYSGLVESILNPGATKER